MLALTEVEPGDHRRDRPTSLYVLALSSLLAIAWRFVSRRHALWAYLLNAAPPAIARWRHRCGRRSSDGMRGVDEVAHRCLVLL